MLHTKFRGNRSTGSGEDFLRIFTIYGHATNKLPFPTHGGSTKYLALTGQAVWEMFEIVDEDGRTPDHGHTISSLGEPSAQMS